MVVELTMQQIIVWRVSRHTRNDEGSFSIETIAECNTQEKAEELITRFLNPLPTPE